MSEGGENVIRKRIWERSAAVDAKLVEIESEDVPGDERDAWVLSLQLDVSFDQAIACVNGVASAEVVETLRGKIAEAFRFGKRKALRALKEALARHANLMGEGA